MKVYCIAMMKVLRQKSFVDFHATVKVFYAYKASVLYFPLSTLKVLYQWPPVLYETSK